VKTRTRRLAPPPGTGPRPDRLTGPKGPGPWFRARSSKIEGAWVAHPATSLESNPSVLGNKLNGPGGGFIPRRDWPLAFSAPSKIGAAKRAGRHGGVFHCQLPVTSTTAGTCSRRLRKRSKNGSTANCGSGSRARLGVPHGLGAYCSARGAAQFGQRGPASSGRGFGAAFRSRPAKQRSLLPQCNGRCGRRVIVPPERMPGTEFTRAEFERFSEPKGTGHQRLFPRIPTVRLWSSFPITAKEEAAKGRT